VDVGGRDAATLSLPDDQDALVAAVAAANPNTIVVLETGGPVTMPWAKDVKGILESWYPESEAGRQLLTSSSPRQPIGQAARHLAASDNDLPHPEVTGLAEWTANHANGADRNRSRTRPDPSTSITTWKAWRWLSLVPGEEQASAVPVWIWLSYTHFAYSNLKADPDAKSVSFDLSNTGAQAGDEIAEVYVTLPASAGRTVPQAGRVEARFVGARSDADG